MIFLVLSGKIIFLFPENMIWHLRQKMKDDLSQKNTRKYDIFFKVSEKMVFSKRTAPGNDLSCIIWKDGIFSPENMIFFPWAGSERRPFSRNHWNIIFSVFTYGCYKRGVTPLCKGKKKNQRWSYPAKIHQNKIDVLDWHPRKSSSNSLYFHGDLYRRFHVLLSSEKKTGNLIYRIEVWLLLQFIRLEIFYNE